MNYTLRRSAKAKNLRISITTQGITVTAPHRYSDEFCHAQVVERSEWINSALKKIAEKNRLLNETLMSNSGKTLHLGSWVDVGVESQLKSAFEFDGRLLTLKKAENIDLFYRSEAKRIFEPKVFEIASFYGVEFSKVTIRNQKSRWGSCSSRGTLSLNYNLVKAPRGIIEYVIVHELCHLLQMNHSTKFWNEVAKLCPHFRESRAWLVQHGAVLTAKPIV